MRIIAPLLVIVLAVVLMRVQAPKRVVPAAELPVLEMMCADGPSIVVGKATATTALGTTRCVAGKTENEITITFTPSAPFSGTCEWRAGDPSPAAVCRATVQ